MKEHIENPFLIRGFLKDEWFCDRETETGMACVIGRLRPCNVFDVKFVALSHNTKRGAALGGILNA